MVLDLGLPRLDGLEVCRQLPAAGRQLPVLMLTGRDSLADKVHGFGEGADDYLVNPFALKELLARLRAMTRRSQASLDILLRVGTWNSTCLLPRRSRRRDRFCHAGRNATARTADAALADGPGTRRIRSGW
jgi:DNA-binding response OmpR family regulator